MRLGSIQKIYPESGPEAGLAASSGALPVSVLVIESSPTRQHVLRRVLTGRFPEIIPCRTPVAALELLNQLQGAARPSAILLALDLASPPRTDELLALLARKLKPGGLLHLATDWEDYAQHMLTVLAAAKTFENTAEPGPFTPRPEGRTLTRFERRGQRLGHGVRDLVFRRCRPTASIG